MYFVVRRPAIYHTLYIHTIYITILVDLWQSKNSTPIYFLTIQTLYNNSNYCTLFITRCFAYATKSIKGHISAANEDSLLLGAWQNILIINRTTQHV